MRVATAGEGLAGADTAIISLHIPTHADPSLPGKSETDPAVCSETDSL